MDLSPVITASFGGIISPWIDWQVDIVKPQSERVFIFRKSWHTLLYFLLWPTVGGVLAWASLESEVTLNPLQALYLGISAPALVTKLIKDGSFILRGSDPPPNSES